jgi:hypothetical protein
MVNQTDLFRDALVKVLVIARTGARDEAAWNEVTGHREQGVRRGEEERHRGDRPLARKG